MRIAVLVIGLPIALLVFLQGCTASAFEDMGDSEDPVGAWGVLLGFVMLVASGLAISFPLASALIFGGSAVVAFLVAAGTNYGDMWVWGGVCAALAIMASFGKRGKDKADQRANQQAALIQQASAVLAGVQPPLQALPTQTVICPQCNASVPANVRFCPNCGLSRATP